MSKKLTGNGLFESSRMMLPEHKEAFIEHQQNVKKKVRPLLDEQEVERIQQLIAESFRLGTEVTFVQFGEMKGSELTGVVTKTDPYQGRIQLTSDDVSVWIPIDHIIDAWSQE